MRAATPYHQFSLLVTFALHVDTLARTPLVDYSKQQRQLLLVLSSLTSTGATLADLLQLCADVADYHHNRTRNYPLRNELLQRAAAAVDAHFRTGYWSAVKRAMRGAAPEDFRADWYVTLRMYRRVLHQVPAAAPVVSCNASGTG